MGLEGDDVDHYQVLGLPSGEEGAALSFEHIEKAYRTQSRIRHPDKRPDDATADFQSLASSYKFLRDESLRRQLDARLLGRRKAASHNAASGVKRRKAVADLEERERAFAAGRGPPLDPAEVAKREDKRKAADVKRELDNFFTAKQSAAAPGSASASMSTIVHVHYVKKEAFFRTTAKYIDKEEKVLVFQTSPTYEELVARVREVLKWTDPREIIELDGKYDVGRFNYSRKKKIPINCELNWKAYTEVVAASRDNSLELFATKFGVDRLHTVLDRCASPHDAITPTQSVPSDDPVELNDMSQHQELEMNDIGDEEEDYVNAQHGFSFGMDDKDMDDEYMEDEFNGTYVIDEDENKFPIKKGLKFSKLIKLQMWLSKYAVKHNRPFMVEHSDGKKCYTVICDQPRCTWVVRARPNLDGRWKITSCQAHHMCKKREKNPFTKHRQLTSFFIACRFSNIIKAEPTIKPETLINLVKDTYGYTIQYGKAQKAKQAAFNMIYGGWKEAYNRLPRLLGAMAYYNPGMYHLVEQIDGVFVRAFWTFDQCIKAFQHCRPVVSIDHTFLTGKYKGTLLVAVAHDASDRVLPLAFALVSTENNDNWNWFINILRTMVFSPSREICIISAQHQGILNAIEIEIPGYARLHNRWCMKHFVANFYKACKNKELAGDLTDLCMAFTAQSFTRRYDKLKLVANSGGKEFLNMHFEERGKWARAYDHDGRRYGDMTSNMDECFNNVLRGIRAFPVTAIAAYTFQKLNAYFQNCSIETNKLIDEEKMYPKNVDEWMELQNNKSKRQSAECIDNVEWKYLVNEPGGTTQNGVQYECRSFKVMLKTCECSCERPRLIHLPCSHLITAANIRSVDLCHVETVRMNEFTLDTVAKTWEARFEPYLDQSQWPEYHGPQIRPDPNLMVIPMVGGGQNST